MNICGIAGCAGDRAQMGEIANDFLNVFNCIAMQVEILGNPSSG